MLTYPMTSDIYQSEFQVADILIQLKEQHQGLTDYAIEPLLQEMCSSISSIISVCRLDLEKSLDYLQRVQAPESLEELIEKVINPVLKVASESRDLSAVQLKPLAESLLLLKKFLVTEDEFISNSWKWQLEAIEKAGYPKDKFCKIVKQATELALSQGLQAVRDYLSSHPPRKRPNQ